MKHKTWAFFGIAAILAAFAFTACNSESDDGPDKVATPSANPGAGMIDGGTAITLTSATEGAEIYYTLDGSAPSKTSTRYGNAPVITADTTLKAIAVKDGMTDSDVLTAAYTIDTSKVATPIADPPAGAVAQYTEITLTTTTEGATIYYTTNGTDPTPSSSRYSSYNHPRITSATTLKAIAVKEGMTDSAVMTVAYTIDANKVVKPTATPAAGLVFIDTSITLSTNTSGAAIYYTTDGTDPTATSNNYAISHPVITTDITLKAVAIKSGMTNSDILTLEYRATPAPSTWNWTVASNFSPNNIAGVAHGNGKFIAVGAGGKMAYSADGVTWTPVTTSGFSSNNISGIAYGSDKFVAVGNLGLMAYSADGETWTPVTTSTFDSNNISGVTYGNGKFIAVGAGGKIAYSEDGVTWTTVTLSTFPSNATIKSVTYGNDKFVAVGQGGTMAYSADGVTWTAIVSGVTSNLTGVAYGNGTFVAVGQGNTLYSAGGVTWAYVSSNSGNNFSGVAYGSNKFVAVGNSRMYYSTDGVTWQTTSSSSSYNSNGVCYGGGKFVAVGNSGYIYYSNPQE
jgi:hypothetical protein